MGGSIQLLQTLKELEKAAEGFHTKGYIFKKKRFIESLSEAQT